MSVKLAGVAVAVLMVGVAGCGQSPSSAESPSGGGGDGGEALQEVYDALEGLEGEERRAKLETLAAEEDATPTWYTSMNLDDSTPLTDAFAERYDIEVELYRASSGDLLQRLLQESQADYAGTDLVSANGPEMQVLAGENMLSPLETPVRDDIFPGAQFDTWLGIYLNVFVAAWNTESVGQEEIPSSWEEVLTDHPGKLAMELGDWDWFATLVQEHLMAEKGMTEDEAVDLFRQAARSSVVVDGHTTMAELMVAGEYDIVSSAYQHRILELKEDGAAVDWERPVEPIIVRPNGLAIHQDTDAPASSLLFLEFVLTDGQDIIADINRTPANTEYGGLPDKYETLTVDFDKMVKQRDKWEELYDKIVHESGSDVVEGD